MEPFVWVLLCFPEPLYRFPAPSTSALPFSEVFVAVFQQLLQAPRFCFRTRLQLLCPTLFISRAQLSLLRFVQRTSLPVSQPGSSLVSSVVSCVCFQLCLGCCQLVFFSCRYVEISAFLCLPSPLFLSPQALAQHFLARWFEAPIIASYVFPAFLYTAKVWTESCNRCICLA